MEINVNFLENLRLEAKFDDFTVITDQPIRYKGDGSAPSPFDYFLASSALCAAYFVRVYCLARDIPRNTGDEKRVLQKWMVGVGVWVNSKIKTSTILHNADLMIGAENKQAHANIFRT